MSNLSQWSFGRVLIVSVARVILAVGWQILRVYLETRRLQSQGSGGVAVSIGVFGIAPVLFGPPMLLLVVWFALRAWNRT